METLHEIETQIGKKTMRVYKFGDKTADGNSTMKNLLGGKGANLAEMNLIGIPVPPGFTITTETCTEYNQLGKEKVVQLLKEEVEKAVSNVEQIMVRNLEVTKTLVCYPFVLEQEFLCQV